MMATDSMLYPRRAQISKDLALRGNTELFASE